MTDKQRARLAMLQATLAVLSQHANLTTANQSLIQDRTRVADLVEDLDPTAETQQIAASAQKPGAVKKKVKNNLALLAGETAAALFAHADATDNVNLQTDSDYTENGLRRQVDNDMLRIARNIHTRATEHFAALQTQGVTQAELDALAAALTTFQQAQAVPRTSRATVKAANSGLAADLREANNILRNRVDKYLLRYQRTQSAFFTAYQSARRTINTASRPTKKEPKP